MRVNFRHSLLLCAVTIAACGGRPAGPPAGGADGPKQAAAALTVSTTRPEKIEAAQTLAASGGLFAWQEIAVGAEVSGYRVSEVLVDVGSKVSKGQVLAKLDETLLRESVAQAEAAVAVQRATLEQAQAKAKRGNSLRESGLLSKQDVEDLNTQAATAAAQLTNAESQLQAARQRLEYAVIRAPDDGVISTRDIVPGQIANASTTLFSLIRQSRVEWRAEISAADIGRVQPGMSASVQRSDGTFASGKVRTVSPGVSSATQRGIAYVDLKLEPLVRPGMYVTGTLQLARAQTLTVPLTAISTRDGFSYVFVIEYNKAVRQQRVTLGRVLNDKVEVREGITSEDSIVANGVGFLRDGDVVRIADGAPQPTQATQAK